MGREIALRNMSEKVWNKFKSLPRIALNNIRDNPGARQKSARGRGQHGGDDHGCGNKSSLHRQNYMRLGYETGNTPFYLKVPNEPYYKHHHVMRQYPPVTLFRLQQFIDLGFLNPSKPIDLTSLCNTKQYTIYPDQRQFGFHLTDEGLDVFKAKVNIEVQWASQAVIAAVERNGGVITTAYYDMHSLWAVIDPLKFFKKGVPIPKRMLPPEDIIRYYSDPKFRGYLADPKEVIKDRLVLAQKFGYELPDISANNTEVIDMLAERKDPRQIFYGLEPGWVINLKDKTILKPKSELLKQYYSS